MALNSKEKLIDVQGNIQRLKKLKIISKSATEELITSLRRDLHRLVIETEGLIAVSTEESRSKRSRAGK